MVQYLLVCDNPAADGPEYVGPFPSVEEAEEYAHKWIGCPAVVAELEPLAMETTASLRRKTEAGDF
jgi:hypothetical protein